MLYFKRYGHSKEMEINQSLLLWEQEVASSNLAAPTINIKGFAGYGRPFLFSPQSGFQPLDVFSSNTTLDPIHHRTCLPYRLDD